jgi:hypothetical protein
MKIKKPYLDDELALAADVCLTSIVYTRTNASIAKWKVLRARISNRKKSEGFHDN